MPTYEYACSTCDSTLEVQQKMSDAALTVCPSCGAAGLRKLFSGVGIHFKGSGFYRTDSRDAKSSGTSTTSAGSGSAASSSTTPAAPAPAAPAAPAKSTSSTPAASTSA